MDIEKIICMQKELDKHIEKKHGLENTDLYNDKILALLVEIGELANETRCFKFWSLKPSSPQEKVLEEFVDGIHFIVSLGIECGFGDIKNIERGNINNVSLTEQFLNVFAAVENFRLHRSKDTYINMFQSYLQLAGLLGFSDEDIKQAYMEKNEVNHQRQEQGY